MADLKIDDIDAAEGAIKNVRVKMDSMGRELFLMREGTELGREYGFDRYRRGNYCGPNYFDQEGPDWGVGTPILSLIYYWPRAENVITVTLPLRYLTLDWRAEETGRLADEREAARKIAAERAAEAILNREASEREQYAKLKAKFEDTSK